MDILEKILKKSSKTSVLEEIFKKAIVDKKRKPSPNKGQPRVIKQKPSKYSAKKTKEKDHE